MTQAVIWRRTRPYLFHLALALFFLFFTLGCSLLNRNADQPPPLEQAASPINLVCSEECARRGQCGTIADGRSVILGHPERPVVSGHQLVFATDTPVTLVGTSIQRLQIIATSEQFDHTFYLVTRPNDGRSGWVAGWCVGQ
ncbi:MAG: hypothetical protein IPM39_19175 [Chloroflexi bacterium]|nr:hypothetical protein [Chloroflexota bacterium]